MSEEFHEKLDAAKRNLWQKLSVEERFLLADHFFMTAKEIIIDNAPRGLSENQLKRYVYEKMYNEPPPDEIWR